MKRRELDRRPHNPTAPVKGISTFEHGQGSPPHTKKYGCHGAVGYRRTSEDTIQTVESGPPQEDIGHSDSLASSTTTGTGRSFGSNFSRFGKRKGRNRKKNGSNPAKIFHKGSKDRVKGFFEDNADPMELIDVAFSENFSSQIETLLSDAKDKDKEDKRRQNVVTRMKHMIDNKKVDLEKLENKLTGKARVLQRVTLTVFHEAFDVFSTTEEALVGMVGQMISKFQLEVVFNKDYKKMNLLCQAIQRNYNQVPYHNWYHGFSVAHMATIFLLRAPYLAECLGKRYILAFIIAALGHDIDHPGNDSRFEILDHSYLAEAFHNESILENYHASKLLLLLTNEDLNVFYLLSSRKQDEIRKFIVGAVLATDLHHHQKNLDFLQQIDNLETAVKDNKKVRNSVMKSILHACDLSGQCMDLPTAIIWERRVFAEMRNQANLARQKKIAMEVPPFMNDRKLRAQSQVGFIDNIIAPLWKEMARLLPRMQPFHENLTTTVRSYYEILSIHGEEMAQDYVVQNSTSLRQMLGYENARMIQEKNRKLDAEFEKLL